MDIYINEVTSTVRAVDDDALLSPETMRAIVHAVLEAMEAKEAHRARVQSEQRVVGSVRAMTPTRGGRR
jgi:hypothetical protein